MVNLYLAEVEKVELTLSPDLQLILAHLIYAVCFHGTGIFLCMLTRRR